MNGRDKDCLTHQTGLNKILKNIEINLKVLFDSTFVGKQFFLSFKTKKNFNKKKEKKLMIFLAIVVTDLL